VSTRSISSAFQSRECAGTRIVTIPSKDAEMVMYELYDNIATLGVSDITTYGGFGIDFCAFGGNTVADFMAEAQITKISIG
jgi:hypothetical protein